MESFNLTTRSLLEAMNNPIDFFKLLPRTKDEYLPIIQKIQKIQEVDYFELALKALDSGMNAWEISRPLENIGYLSKLNSINIINFYRKIYESMNGDLTSYVQYDITKELTTCKLDFSSLLLEELLEISEPFVVYHISTILDVLHNVHSQNQYLKTIKLMKNSNHIFHVRSAVNTIIKFKLSEEQVHEVFELFKTKYQLHNEEIDTELIYTTHHLIKKHAIFKKFIILYADSQNIQILYQLSRILSLDRKECYTEEWFVKCLFALSSTDIEYVGIIRNIDSILSELIKDNQSYETVKIFLYQWINSSDVSVDFSNKTLSSFISSLNESELLGQFITESLFIENSKLHKVLPYFIEESTGLNIKIMESFTEKDFIYICKKVLGYFYEFEVMTRLIFSILSVKNISSDVQNLVIEVFVNHIGKNYAHDTLEYFETLKDNKLNICEKEAKKTILKYVRQYRESIKKLPNLKELKPSSQQNRLITRVQHVSMSDMLKEVKKDSFFGSLGTTVMLSQGKGWFSDRNGKFTDISYVNRISNSVTMPSAIRSHPIHFEWERFHFRLAEKEL